MTGADPDWNTVQIHESEGLEQTIEVEAESWWEASGYFNAIRGVEPYGLPDWLTGEARERARKQADQGYRRGIQEQT